MIFPSWLEALGDKDFRGQCPLETAEQMTFFSEIRKLWPDTIGRIAIHTKNEGKRTKQQAAVDKANGMTKGAADIIIPCCPPIVIELKRRDHTKSGWEDGQLEYLEAAKRAGARVYVSLGYAPAIELLKSIQL